MHELTRLRRLRHRLERGGRSLILTYHRIHDASRTPGRLAVSPARFDEQMEVVRRRFRALTMAELVDELARGRVQSRSILVTFDDGYVDNLVSGLPLLERHGIPAAVYVTAGQRGASREFCWKEVEHLLLEPGRLPERLEVRLPNIAWSWDLRSAALYTEADAPAHRRWGVGTRPRADALARRLPVAAEGPRAARGPGARREVIESLVEAAEDARRAPHTEC